MVEPEIDRRFARVLYRCEVDSEGLDWVTSPEGASVISASKNRRKMSCHR